MATLQKIRNRAGLLALIIGFALFAFIIGDFLNSGSSLFRQSQQTIAKIGGSSLDYKEYEARISEMEEVYKIQTGQSSLDESLMSQIRESVFETIVHERLLDEQAADLGVAVTGKEIFSMINGKNVHPMIQQLPIFQNPQTGRFDRTIMMNFLQTIQKDDLSSYSEDAQEQIKKLKAYWLFWENNLKYTRLEEKINAILSKSIQANSIDAKASFAERSENVDFEYIFQPYSALPDSLFKVSGREVKNRYNEQKERFVQKPYRSAKYIVVDIRPSQEDYKAVESRINSLQKDFATTTDLQGIVNGSSDTKYMDCYVSNRSFDPTIKSFVESSGDIAFLKPTFTGGSFQMARLIGKTVAPDSVKARQIVLDTKDQVLADSLIAVIRKGGNFDELAAKYSKSKSNAEMGWFREIDAISLGSEFVKATFNASVNSVFSVKTKQSLYVVQVTDRTAPIAKSKIALVTMKLSPSSQTYSNIYNKLNRLVASNQSAENFFAAASAAGYVVQNAQMVHAADLTLAEVPQMRQAVRFVFNNKMDKLSGILDNNANQFIVVGVTGISDGDYESVESVKHLLSREIVNEKKAIQMTANLKAKNATSLTSLSNAVHLAIDTARSVNFSLRRIVGIGEEPALVSAVTMTPENKLSEPVKGKNGIYVFQVVSKTKSREVFNMQQEKASWNASNMYRIMYQSFEAVKNASKIKDTRIRFY
jgi:peptidyl-prolyl cis-trans isomerase D